MMDTRQSEAKNVQLQNREPVFGLRQMLGILGLAANQKGGAFSPNRNAVARWAGLHRGIRRHHTTRGAFGNGTNKSIPAGYNPDAWRQERVDRFRVALGHEPLYSKPSKITVEMTAGGTTVSAIMPQGGK
jgi:hypothetical protein